jgi:hypothetical protein
MGTCLTERLASVAFAASLSLRQVGGVFAERRPGTTIH